MYLIIRSMAFLAPASVNVCRYVPEYASALKILQALTTLVPMWLVAKRSSTGKIPSSIKALRPGSDF